MKTVNFCVILSTILLGLPAAYSQCNQCLENQAMCLDDKRFVFCFGNDLTSTTIGTCGEDLVCTSQQGICVQRTDATPPACPTPAVAEQGRSCSKCTTTRTRNFACLSEDRFTRCNDEGTPNFDLQGSCPEGYICNVGYDAMCVNKLFYQPSCFEETTVGPATTVGPSQQCASFDSPGIYPVGSDCSRYLVCSRTGGELKGEEHSCPFPSYFNVQTKRCALDKPAGCPERTVTTVTTPLPSLSPLPSTVTTVNPLIPLCTENGGVGAHPYQNSCTQYLVCTNNNGRLGARIESCRPTSYFEPVRRRCELSKPAGCVDT